jgi:tetratricopeptide (TPR) repeat protein
LTRALLLDPALPEGHLARAFILWSPAKSVQHAEALEALQQVLAVQPNLEQAHNRIASICLHVGRLHEATIAHEHVRRANPKTRSGNLEFTYLYSGDFARAEEAGEAWIRDRPGAITLLSSTTAALYRRSGSCQATAGDSVRTTSRGASVHQPSGDHPRASESERGGARVCAQSD